MPPFEPLIPSTPFEAIACDYFKHMGHYYFVAADRLSGWLEVQQIRVGTNEAGSQGLCKALRRIMITFGVPVEISSDGGPEFKAGETKAFFEKWGIRHRLSSVSLPSSNGRAELAVKTAKRLLMDNISPNGSLDNDGMVRALLVYRNTPDPGCKLSPAQILLGRPLRDTLPYISKDVMIFNNPEIQPQWRDAWNKKEEALKARYVKTLENLSEHSRPLSPLKPGDCVFIQNQNGRFPKKWDKSGTVVEVRGHDQYVVKVAGSGKLTLRNRRFLRKYEPHNLSNKQTAAKINATPSLPPTGFEMPDPSSEHGTTNFPLSIGEEPAEALWTPSVLPSDDGLSGSQSLSLPESQQQSPASPANGELVHRPDKQTADRGTFTSQVTPSGVMEKVTSVQPTIGEKSRPRKQLQPKIEQARRSAREKKPRQVYDASSGKYVAPSTVADD